MLKFIILFFSLLIGFESLANDDNEQLSKSERTLLSKERIGIRSHKKGHYKKAYKNLYETATWGLKDSQYFLALMYLKGQHVKQNTLIGMGLLAVANEAKIKERRDLYETIYNNLSESEKSLVDAQATDYIAKFGIKVKGYTCSDAQDLGSRKKVVNCQRFRSKAEGSFVID